MHKEDYPQFSSDWKDGADKPPEHSFVSDIARVVIGLVLIAGMVWLSGGHDLFRFRETPAGIEQEKMESKVDAEELTVPLNIILLRSEGELGARRNTDDVERLVTNASHIWAQGAITLEVVQVQERTMTDNEIFSSFLDPTVFRQLPEYEEGVVNVILSRHIPGSVNGVAYGGLDTITVAEVVTTFDFRTFAHEIGHQLGLGHVPDRGRLMSSGEIGAELTVEEVLEARSYAERFQ